MPSTPDRPAASAHACPDCGKPQESMMAALAHMKDEHAADHPGQEPCAISTGFALVWEADDDE